VYKSGGFQHFKTHHNFHNVKLGGEAARADAKGRDAFKEELPGTIVSKKYLPEQILDADERSLFWKHMPGQTHSSRLGLRCSRADGLTLLWVEMLQGSN
jgi:hypothetical protein